MSTPYSPEQISRIASLDGSRCPECTQHVQVYEYHMTNALLNILGMIVQYVEGTRVNRFKAADLNLTRGQFTNWSKLTMWGLTASLDDPLYYCLTPLGMKFYYGHAWIARSKFRYDNHEWAESVERVFSHELDPSLEFNATWMKTHGQTSNQLTLI